MPFSENQTETDDSKKDVGVDEIIGKISEGLFGILFITNKHSDHNIYWHFLEIFIDHMQDLAFPLTFVFAPWISSIGWFQQMLTWFSPEKLIGKNQILYDILSAIIGLTLMNAAWVGYSFSQNRFRFIWTLKILRVTLGLFSTVLFIPILAFFTDQIMHCTGPHGDTVSCWTGDTLLQSVVTVVLMVLFVILALAVKATFFEPDPHVKDMTCRPHSRLDMLYVAFRAALTVLSIVFAVDYDAKHGTSSTVEPSIIPNSTEATSTHLYYSRDNTQVQFSHLTPAKFASLWAFTGLCVILSFILAVGYIWYIPFYHYNYSILRAGMMTNFFWASLCLVYSNIRPYSDIGIVYLILCPFAFIFAYYFMRLRRTLIGSMPLSVINDPLLVELKVRFQLLDRGIFFKDHTKAAANNTPAVPGLAALEAATNEKTDKEFLDEVNETFLTCLKAMPKSCRVYLFAASFHLSFMGNRAQCLALTAKASLMHPKLDEAFMIFKRQRLLNDKFAGGDVIDFIAFEQNMKLAKLNERKATVAGIQFWSELMKKRPSFYKLQLHGAAISSSVSVAQSHYVTLIKLTPDSPDVYRLYGKFLIDVLNDKKNGQDLLDHADELVDEAEREVNSDDDDSDDSSGYDSDGSERNSKTANKCQNLFSGDNCLITISGEKNNLGSILTINDKACKQFGFKKSECIGRNINTIIPSPFAEAHDAYLVKYLETGVAKVMEKSREVLGLHNDGYLMRLMLCVKHVVQPNGKQIFIGVIQPTKNSSANGYMILDPSDYKVKHVTLNVANIFNYVPEKNGKEAFLHDWIPGFGQPSIDRITAEGGFDTELIRPDCITKMKITGQRVEVAGLSVLICRTSSRNISPCKNIGEGELACVDKDKSCVNQSLEDVGAMPLVFSAKNSRADLTTESAQEASGEVISTKSGDNFTDEGRFSRVSAKIKKKNAHKLANLHQKDESSSYSKGSSARNVKKILSDKSQYSNKQLNYIHSAYIICFLVLIAYAIYDDVKLRGVYSEICDKITELNNYLESLLRVIQICDSTRSIDLQRVAKVTGSGFYSADGYDTAVKSVLSNTQYITDILDRYLDRVTDTMVLLDKNGDVIQRLNVFEAISTFVAASEYSAQANLTDPLLQPQIQLILDNGLYTIMGALNQSAVLQKERFTNYTYSQPGVITFEATLAPVWVTCIIFLVVFPLYYRIELYRNRFLDMFCDIPKEIVKGIHDAHYKRLVEAEENSDDDLDTGPGFRAKMGLSLGVNSSAVGSVDGFDTHNIPTDFDANVTSSSPRKFNIISALISFFTNHNRIGVYSLGIIAITVIFFVVSGVQVYSYALTVENTATSTFWSKQRAIYSSAAVFSAREHFLATITTYPVYKAIGGNYLTMSFVGASNLQRPGWITMFCSENLEWMDYTRMFGEISGESMDHGVQLVLFSDKDPHTAIEMVSACPDEATISAACTTTANGLFANGLHAAVTWLIENLSFITHEIELQSEVGFTVVDDNATTTTIAFLPTVTSAIKPKAAAATALPLFGRDAPFNQSNSMDDSLAEVTPLVHLAAIDLSGKMSFVLDADMQLSLMRKLMSDYYIPSLQLSADYFWRDLQGYANWFSEFHISFTVTYIVGLCLIYFFIIRVIMNALAEELRRTSGLVHMLPPELITSVPSFRKWAHMEGIKTAGPNRSSENPAKVAQFESGPTPAKVLKTATAQDDMV
ncbi:hypothetical protein CcCBS67573_g01209 [Chytriomyces confervae]|uniref:PAS domain-containing protein n=1 Tax=Chytriomyces confervae TaxID=246404 RepID=A0A507FPY5_9FUNG|nr:hypothetical protein CcCBS67573_g01209 [Chytriomyces confervae]